MFSLTCNPAAPQPNLVVTPRCTDDKTTYSPGRREASAGGIFSQIFCSNSYAEAALGQLECNGQAKNAGSKNNAVEARHLKRSRDWKQVLSGKKC